MNNLIFDGHNDLLARLWLADHQDPAQAFLHEHLNGQIDFLRCRKGHVLGGLFAIFVPPFSYVKEHAPHKIPQNMDDYSQDCIHNICLKQLSYLQQIENASQGRAKICKTVADIEDCIKHQKLAMILHLEGAEVFGHDFAILDEFYDAGLRSVGALWNLPNQFGHGLDAKFPHSPDTGAGLTSLGKQLIRRCNDKNIVVDVSHMNEKAFWDTAEILTQPIVATHSNVHALCAQARNLTDQQLTAIAYSKGMVGVNFDTAFLRPDGQRNKHTDLNVLIAHIEYLLEKLGEDHVGFGSDYDGGFMSEAWADISYFPNILNALQKLNYSDALIQKISHQNWLNVLKKIWQE